MRISANANTVTVTDAAQHSKTMTMDGLGNLKQVSEPRPGGGTYITSYTYDVLNHLVRVTMPRDGNTQARTFNYIDPATNNPGVFLRSATNPENGKVTYTYNANQMLATKSDANGNTLTYSYDSFNRLTQVSSGGNTIRTYFYDSNPFDSSFSNFTAGRLTAVQYSTILGGTGQFIDMFDYTIPGQLATKRLQFNQGVFWTRGGQNFSTPETLNLDAGYTYDTEGAMTRIQYPSTVQRSGSQLPVRQEVAGPFYTYSLDTMHRAIGLTDQNFTSVVSSVQYGPANELLSLNYFGVSESRSYNNMLQMTSLTVNGPSGGVLNLQYRFSPNQNNGKITSQMDMLSGEEVQYSYDSLQRLISASTTAASDAVAPAWGQSFGYDGFGNLNAKTVTKGTAPSLSVAIDTTTNRVMGSSFNYDANGNLLSLPSGGVGTYDVENRLVCVACPPFGPPGTQYGYDGANKRIWKYTGDLDADGFGNATGLQIYVYGADGKQLGTYVTTVQMGNAANPLLTDDASSLNVYFRGKKVVSGPSGSLTAFAQDRLGSSVKTYPYGEEKTASGGDGWKFSTYLRDGSTNLDYADQRYYTFQLARFMTADPYKANSGGPGDTNDPGSWNRYAYTGGDPVNRIDPGGTYYRMDVSDGGGGFGWDDILSAGIGPANDFFGGFGVPGEPPAVGNVTPQPDSKGKAETITINDAHLSGPPETAIKAALGWLDANIDPDCAKWLQTGTMHNISDFLNQLGNNNAIGWGTITSSNPASIVNAVSGTKGTLGDGSAAQLRLSIVVNINGAFFKPGVQSGGYSGSQAAISLLLHEFGHTNEVPGFEADFNNPGAGARNNARVATNCEKTLAKLH